MIRDDPMPVPTGTRIGPYEIVGWLGAGGMGEVYRARDPRLGREVAIKLIPETFATDASRLQRFEQEARAAGQLNHPEHPDRLRCRHARRARPTSSPSCSRGSRSAAGCTRAALPRAQGDRLRTPDRRGTRRRARQGHRPPRPEAGQPLHHERRTRQDPRLRHRQAHAARATTLRNTGAFTETGPGTVVGTAGYMSPEQVRGETVDHRSDIFSFGAILYEMLTGRPAFTRETAAETMAAILKEDPPEPLIGDRPAGARAHRLALSGEGARGALSVGARPGVRPGVSVGDQRRCIAGRRLRDAVALAYGAGRRRRRPEPPGGHCELATPAHSAAVCRSPAGQRPVRALHGLGGDGRRRRNFPRWEVRRVPGRPRRAERPLGEPGGHRTLCQPHVRYPADDLAGAHPAEIGLFGRRSGDLVHWVCRSGNHAHAHDRRPATGVSERGRKLPGLVSRRHPHRLFQIGQERFPVRRRPHRRRRP